jgi:hypothetical protein
MVSAAASCPSPDTPPPSGLLRANIPSAVVGGGSVLTRKRTKIVVGHDEPLSKLATLRALGDTLVAIEARHGDRLSPDDDPGLADREAAVLALVATIDALRRFHMETGPLDRLNAALHDVAVHGRHAAMLVTPRRASRPPDSLNVQMVKGALAAIMKVRIDCGEKRKDAAVWVARKLPPRLARKLSRKPITGGTIADWYDRWGGEHGEKGHARDHYRTIVDIFDVLRRAGVTSEETRLLAVMRSIDIKIPENPPV